MPGEDAERGLGPGTLRERTCRFTGGGRLVAADVSSERGVAGLSLPAMGALQLRPRSREATLRLAQELYEKVHEPEADATLKRSPRSTGFVGPLRRVDPPDEDMAAMDVDARFAATGPLGHIGLWSGMVWPAPLEDASRLQEP